MRVFYIDPGLHDVVGHHANYCRYIVGEFRGRGAETLVFGHRELPPALQSELGAAPRQDSENGRRLSCLLAP